jgi:DNA-directed RNA polymerase specialized sigma24 family protein
MRVWQELPYQEIAEIVGKSEASCKMAYSRALKHLKKAAVSIGITE